MYTTIKEAFANGTGDVFFTKNNLFVAVRRKDNHDYYFNNGFTFLTFDEIMDLDKLQKEIPE